MCTHAGSGSVIVCINDDKPSTTRRPWQYTGPHCIPLCMMAQLLACNSVLCVCVQRNVKELEDFKKMKQEYEYFSISTGQAAKLQSNTLCVQF